MRAIQKVSGHIIWKTEAFMDGVFLDSSLYVCVNYKRFLWKEIMASQDRVSQVP